MEQGSGDTQDGRETAVRQNTEGQDVNKMVAMLRETKDILEMNLLQSWGAEERRGNTGCGRIYFKVCYSCLCSGTLFNDAKVCLTK